MISMTQYGEQANSPRPVIFEVPECFIFNCGPKRGLSWARIAISQLKNNGEGSTTKSGEVMLEEDHCKLRRGECFGRI